MTRRSLPFWNDTYCDMLNGTGVAPAASHAVMLAGHRFVFSNPIWFILSFPQTRRRFRPLWTRRSRSISSRRTSAGDEERHFVCIFCGLHPERPTCVCHTRFKHLNPEKCSREVPTHAPLEVREVFPMQPCPGAEQCCVHKGSVSGGLLNQSGVFCL